MWSKGFPPIDTTADQFKFMRDNHCLGSDASGDPVVILNCSMSIYQGRYNWTYGGVKDGDLFGLALAKPEYGAIFSAGFAMDAALSHLSLQDAAALAAYQNDPDQLATVFGNRFSRAAAVLTAGISAPLQNFFDPERFNNVLVTRVPKLPLYTLVALNVLYALFALTLAGFAVWLAEPLTTQDVKERLTIDGLAVSLFKASAHRKKGVDQMQQLFDEHNKGATQDSSSEVDEVE